MATTGLMPQPKPGVGGAMQTMSAGMFPANENDSTASRLEGMLTSDSPLMKVARQEGVKMANRRGLPNSSMSAGAAMAEMIKAATPIAAQDASIAGQKNLFREDAAAQMQRLQTSTDAEMARLERSLANANEQQRVDIEAQMTRLRETNNAEMARLKEQGRIQGSLNTQQFGFQRQLQTQSEKAEYQRLTASLNNATDQQKRDIAAQMSRLVYGTQAEQAMQAKQIASQQLMQSREFSHLTAQQKTEIASRIQLADMQIDAEAAMQGRQLSSEEKRQALELKNRELLQGREFAHLTDQQKRELASRMTLQQAEFGQQRFLQTEQGKQEMARLTTQLKSSENMQQREIGAQMERLQVANKAERDRLTLQLNQADAAQRREIEAQMERLETSMDGEMERLAAAAGFDMTRLKEQGKLDIARDAAQARNAQDLARVQGQIQSALQAQGNTEQVQRMGVELANQLQLQGKEQENNLARIAASGDQDIRRLVEAANQERVTLQQSIAAQDRERMANAMVNIFQVESQLRAALLSNDKISATERAAYERSITALSNPLRQYIDTLFGSPAQPTPPPPQPPITPGAGGLLPGGSPLVTGGTGGTAPPASPGLLPTSPSGGVLPPDTLPGDMPFGGGLLDVNSVLRRTL